MAREAIDMAYKLFSRGDRDGFLAMLTPDCVIHSSGQLPGLDARYEGHEGALRWWDDLREPWERFELTHRIEAEAGDRYLIAVHVRGIGATSGAEVEQRVWHVIELAGTQACAQWSHWDRDEALRLLQERNTERPG